MNENEKQKGEETNEEQTGIELGPTEKIKGVSPDTGSLVPGAQNPESEEVKKEINPNTE